MEIYIKKYPVFMKVGYSQEERLTLQEVFISTRLQFKFEGPLEDLGRTVDYGQVMSLIHETLFGKEFKLLESICDVMGRKLLEEFALLQAVLVKVEKTTIPRGLNKGAKVQVAHLFDRA